MSKKLENLIDELDSLTLMEAAELSKMLEEKWGVSAAAPIAAVAAPVAEAAPAEEKTEFDVVITDIGAKKIEVIKTVRQLTTLGLKEAKNLVDSAPAAVLEGTGKEAAEDAKGKLEAAGATVEIR